MIAHIAIYYKNVPRYMYRIKMLMFFKNHSKNTNCNNVALPYFTFGQLPSPRNIKIIKKSENAT